MCSLGGVPRPRLQFEGIRLEDLKALPVPTFCDLMAAEEAVAQTE